MSDPEFNAGGSLRGCRAVLLALIQLPARGPLVPRIRFEAPVEVESVSLPRLRPALIPSLLLAALLSACRTTPSLPPVDLQATGWRVRQGQAVWTAARGASGVAGELIVAIRGDGACFVQFAKPPFTLVTAHSQAGAWALELPPTRRHFHGLGQPPARFVWIALAEALAGRAPGGGWQFAWPEPAGWRLANPATGEALEGYFTP